MEPFIQMTLAFVIGMLFGAFAMFIFSPARTSRKEMEEELAKNKAELENYRKDVDAHFLETAELVNRLTESYRDVHQHLSKGTEQLCSEEGRKQALSRTRSLTDRQDEPQETLPTQPPLDYAPSQRGTLSEHFGLREEKLSVDGPFSPIDVEQSETSTSTDPDTDVVIHPPRDYAEDCTDQGCSPTDPAKKVEEGKNPAS